MLYWFSHGVHANILHNDLDLERRQIEVEERNYLKDMGIVTEMQCDLGMLRANS